MRIKIIDFAGFLLLKARNLVQYTDQQWEFSIILVVESVYIPCYFSGKNYSVYQYLFAL